MITKLVFHEGQDRLELIFPDGHMARQFLDRLYDMAEKSADEVRQRVHVIDVIRFGPGSALAAFNSGDDIFARTLRDRAQVKRQKIVTHDPGSVAGSYWEGPEDAIPAKSS